jgi:hypothetical protein
MDKGQHLRLLISAAGSTPAYAVVGLATELTLHLSASTENSTTKDTTDATGGDWDEFDITQRNGDISFSGLVNVGTDAGAKTFNDIMSGVASAEILWEICAVGGANNRVVSKLICSGSGLITNVQATGQVGQLATYTGTIQIVGPVTVGTN